MSCGDIVQIALADAYGPVGEDDLIIILRFRGGILSFSFLVPLLALEKSGLYVSIFPSLPMDEKYG